MCVILAQTAVGPSFWIWLGVLVVVVLVGGGVLLAVRRRLFTDDASPDIQAGGMLEQLRVMHAEGKITKEEYEETRRSLIEKVSPGDLEPPQQPGAE